MRTAIILLALMAPCMAAEPVQVTQAQLENAFAQTAGACNLGLAKSNAVVEALQQQIATQQSQIDALQKQLIAAQTTKGQSK